MSRVRMVNGDMAKLIETINAQLGTPLSKDEESLLRKEQASLSITSGTLSDPVGMLHDALGRFEEVPEKASTFQRAKDLCRYNAVEGGKYGVEYDTDKDVIIVLHPVKGTALGVNDEPMSVDRYMVFGRDCQGLAQGTCYACENADRRYGPDQRNLAYKTPNAQATHKGQCYRKNQYPNWVPIVFTWAHSIDDAEELAMELASAWSATAEQKLDQNGMIDWSRVVDQNFDSGNSREYSFSGDYIAGMLAANPNAWSSLSADAQAEQLG